MRKDKAQALKLAAAAPPSPLSPVLVPGPTTGPTVIDVQPLLVEPTQGDNNVLPAPPIDTTRALKISGHMPGDSWNRVGTRLIPKLRSGQEMDLQVAFTVKVGGANVANLRSEILLVLEELGLLGVLTVTEE